MLALSCVVAALAEGADSVSPPFLFASQCVVQRRWEEI